MKPEDVEKRIAQRRARSRALIQDLRPNRDWSKVTAPLDEASPSSIWPGGIPPRMMELRDYEGRLISRLGPSSLLKRGRKRR